MLEETAWTVERLEDLYDRYNQLGYRAELSRPILVIGALDERILAQWRPKSGQVVVDISKHDSDQDVEESLVHEMVHLSLSI